MPSTVFSLQSLASIVPDSTAATVSGQKHLRGRRGKEVVQLCLVQTIIESSSISFEHSASEGVVGQSSGVKKVKNAAAVVALC